MNGVIYKPFVLQIYKIIFRFPNYTIGNPAAEFVVDGNCGAHPFE